MDALAPVEEQPPAPPNHLLFAEHVAVWLADEGIPVRAIARSTKLPSEKIYEVLRDAIERGTIIEMPRDDWPAGSTRGQRIAFNGTPLEDDEAMQFACARCFRTTRLESALLVVLIKRNELTKAQLHTVIETTRGSPRAVTDPKMVDVMIHKLRRKLKPAGLTITTVWGLGYLMPLADRERAIAVLTAFVSVAGSA